MFCGPNFKKGIIPLILQEILETRIQIKNSLKSMKLKSYKNKLKKSIQILDSRQLGLKLLSNVIYGYTGASFSGRMPCIDLADAIVETARKTLENVK